VATAHLSQKGAMRPIPRLLIVMMHKSSGRLIELPDRKELTLCEAVTAFIYGKAYDLRQLARDTPKEQIANAQDLLDRLHQAAYAGRVKFRALQESDDPRLDTRTSSRFIYTKTRSFICLKT
jgi:hypothetical protein